MEKPNKILIRIKKEPQEPQEPLEVPELQTPTNPSALTLHLDTEKYRERAEREGWAMASCDQGAFRGTRSKGSEALVKTAQASSLAPPPSPTPVSPRAPLQITTANSTPWNITPKPKDASPVGTKRKSALKQASAPKRQKRVRLDSVPSILIVNTDSPVETPAPESAPQRTPSIKINFKPKTPAPAPTPVAKKPKAPHTNGSTPSSAKKRKREQEGDESQDEGLVKRVPAPPVRKITIKAKPPPSQTLAAAPLIKLKTKGKIPKRPLGVGYDSELEDREQDPVILDGFILRMQPGDDCEYIKKHISDGTVGVHRIQGGADIQIKLFDVLGRRGIMTVRQQKYAIAMVDLPCIVEGMKSWDRKGWIKSIDVSQMMLVLGKCRSEEEAKNHPLPSDVDAKTFQYANGLTPPMHDVRRRRFARTKRARIDDIESVERKVSQLIQADSDAVEAHYQVYDYDPRLESRLRSASGSEEYSGTEDDAEGEEDDYGDADGEEDDQSQPMDYFAAQREAHGQNAEATIYPDSPAMDLPEAELEQWEAMLASDGEEDSEEVAATNGHSALISTTLQVPDEGASSFAVTSTSASPSATAAHTPASIADVVQSSDEDGDDADADPDAEDSGDDDESDEDEDEAEKEDDEAMQRAKEQIQDLEAKIREQEGFYQQNTNRILRGKIRTKIETLKGDVAVMKRTAGLAGDEGDGDGD